MLQTSIARLYEDNAAKLGLGWVSSRGGDALPVRRDSADAAALVGHLNLIHPNRLHVLGHPEVHYYLKLEPARRLYYARELITGGPIGLVIAEGLAA